MKEKKYLLLRAKAYFRSIRNSGYSNQKAYEENVETARYVLKDSDIVNLRRTPMCGPKKSFKRLLK
jgi:hypothetical protein